MRLNEMFRRNREKRPGEGGFTLIELLVVIVILGILAAVVVFAVQGTGDKGAASAAKIDVRTLRTAEETYRANHGGYASEADLVGAQLLSEQSQKHDIVLVGDSGTAQTYYITSPPALAAKQAGDGSVPVGGILRVPGTNSAGNVTGNNFVNPAVTSSGTSHPNVEYMFNGLLRWAENNTVQPDLAQSYTLSPDQQTATFTLRPGMVWHNGTPILNSDVKFTVEEALLKFHSRTGPSLGPALGATGGGTTSLVISPTAITLPAADVVQFNFVYPYAQLLRQMNVTEAPIIPENVYGPCRFDGAGAGTDNINASGCPANNPTSNVDFPADTGTNKSPVGSGPFRFKSRNSTTAALVFVKRSAAGGVGGTPYHHAGLPFADELQQVPTGDIGNALLAKTIDVGTPANNRILPITPPSQTTADITPANGFTLAGVPRGAGGGNCITTFSFHLWQYGSNVNTIGGMAANTPYNHEFFGDPTLVDPDGAGPLGLMTRGKVVRRAISMAIDRTALFNSIDFGKGRVPDSPYHSLLPPYAPQAAFPTFNTATAATWLDNAGWTVSGAPAIRRSTGAVGMPPAGTPLGWAVRRASAVAGQGQDAFYLGMKTQLAASPLSIDVGAGTGSHAEAALDASTNTTGILVAGGSGIAGAPSGRNYDMLAVSFCNGDDPVIGVRRQYHSDGIPSSGGPANFTNPSGVRSTVMDGLWNTAFGSNYTSKHQAIQAMSADEAYQIYFDETSTTRAWRTGCAGFNNFNTGLYVETASCA